MLVTGGGALPAIKRGRSEETVPIKFSLAFLFAFCGFALMAGPLANGQAGAAIGPSSGKALCSALTPADFTKAGVPVSALRQANLDGTEGAYCVYDSKAGKVEFDIFFPAGANPKEVIATEKTVLGEAGGKYESVTLAGAESAQISLGASPTIVVRKGKAVFDIGIPNSTNARQQLMALAQIVLGRLKQ
jgi:hypothetical protein